ncbi:MAG: DUF4402 domain-containing protein [Sphingomonadales bacterium]|nr:DUF4402 domain-containing protein [Sphingomonadales bacterium]
MVRPAPLLLALMLLACPAPGAAQDCALCFGSGPGEAGARPLSIEITSDLTFSRMALTGQGEGSASIDPQTGSRRVEGGMVELGGVTVQGHGRITGEPNRRVRVEMPASVSMSTSQGGTAELTDLTTDLPAWPMLDATGSLEFSFGGRLRMRGNMGGNLRGRIPISVDYN